MVRSRPNEQMPFLWLGNHPAPDLCNTTPVVAGKTLELLPNLDALRSWADEAGVVIPDGALSPAEANATLAFVHRLRGSLRPFLEHPGERIHEVALNAVLAHERGALRVDRDADEGGPIAIVGRTAAEGVRLAMAAAAVDIARYNPHMVRRCANPECVLLFLDVSKSRRRRWCDMATCGNRAKANAHYARGRG